jgi:3-isopropylmalate/(R)-2-methylmalate dehydratase small subunit
LNVSDPAATTTTHLLRGRVWKYGDSVNTDVIFPGKYTYTLRTLEEIKPHALEDLDPGFARNVRAGDIIVAGRNWGCGSSREQAATCLVANGVGCIVAASFSRIFFRNAWNNGLPAVACPEAGAAFAGGASIEVDLDACRVRTAAGAFPFPPLSPALLEILDAGGLVPWATRRANW